MTSEEKAEAMYDTFHVYNWDVVHGYVTDDSATKEMCCKVIDEIIETFWGESYKGTMPSGYDYWIEVKFEITQL